MKWILFGTLFFASAWAQDHSVTVESDTEAPLGDANLSVQVADDDLLAGAAHAYGWDWKRRETRSWNFREQRYRRLGRRFLKSLIGICLFKDFYRRIGPAGIEGQILFSNCSFLKLEDVNN